MIIKMKYVTILGMKTYTEDIIEQLRECGVLHIVPVNYPESQSLENVADQIFLSEIALQKIQSFPRLEQHNSENILHTVNHIVQESECLDICEDELALLIQEMERFSFLGNFDINDLNKLKERGIHITLYEIDSNKISSIPENIEYAIVGESQKNNKVIAVVNYGKMVTLDLEEFKLPAYSLHEFQEIVKKKKAQCLSIRQSIADYSTYAEHITRNLIYLKSLRDFELVRAGVGSAGQIMFLQGFCPFDKVDILRKVAKKNGWGLLVKDPEPDVTPPTLIRNPGWIQIINPVFTLINTVPGYREFDISFFFLIFFSVFFGMIIGDAGYGILIFLSTILIHNKSADKIKSKNLFYLMYVLSTTTIIWGALTGNWFGIESLTHITPFRLFIIPDLNVYKLQAQRIVMNICFYIAAVHLSIAHILQIFKNMKIWNTFVNTGWVMMIWVMFFVARNQILGTPLPGFFLYLFILSFVLIFFFSFLDKSPNQSFAEVVIANIILSIINTFADTVSYIRLFAVGLATLAVAQSFNNIALDVGFGSFIAALGSIAILLCGHLLNIALAAMAVIVHGIRLNMLEFSSHVGNTWSGYSYTPFQMPNQNTGKSIYNEPQ